MTIFNPQESTHSFSIIPRDHSGANYQVIVVDEYLNTVTVHDNVTGTMTGNRLSLYFIQKLRPDAFYYFKVRVSDNLPGLGDYSLDDYSSTDYLVSLAVLPDYSSTDYSIADYATVAGSVEFDQEIYRGKAYATDQIDLTKFNPVTDYENPTETKNDYIVI